MAEYSAATHIAKCKLAGQIHTCLCGATASCAEDDFWEEWSHIHGHLYLGDREWTDGSFPDWCSPDCFIRWVGENYYVNGIGARWGRLDNIPLDLSDIDD